MMTIESGGYKRACNRNACGETVFLRYYKAAVVIHKFDIRWKRSYELPQDGFTYSFSSWKSQRQYLTEVKVFSANDYLLVCGLVWLIIERYIENDAIKMRYHVKRVIGAHDLVSKKWT